MLCLDERLPGVGELLDPGLVGLDLLLEVLVFLHLAVQVGRVLREGGVEIQDTARLRGLSNVAKRLLRPSLHTSHFTLY